MKRRLLHLLFWGVVMFNPLFFTSAWGSDFFDWIGGASGNWNVAANWENRRTHLNELPPIDADVEINGNVIVTIPNSVVVTIESIFLKGGAQLTIVAGASLYTRKGNTGNDGISLDASCTLTVNGTLYINDPVDLTVFAPDVGLNIDPGAVVMVGSTGNLYIPNAETGAIKVKGVLTNDGSITITNSNGYGILSTGGIGSSRITNNGTLTISGATTGLDLSSSVEFDNYGTVIVSGASGKLLDGSGGFHNQGTFGGNGTVEADDFISYPGSIIAPGASIGTLTFDNDLDLTGVTLLIEINGENTYDQLIVQGEITLDPSTSTLQFGGTYDFDPAPMGDFGIMTSTTGQITGNFTTTSYTLNGAVLTQSTGFAVSFSNFLPVELTAFTAQPLGKAVQLRWSTATETNNNYFSIEHSTDGRYFTEIGRVGGAGTSQELHFYSFVHDAPAKGMNYYRLDQHDYDGRRQYSNIEALFFGEKNHWTAYPTLARDLVNVEWQEVPNRRSVVEAFNLSGQMVYRQVAPSQSAVLQIPVADWAPGMYWLMVQSNGKVEVQQFMKE